MAWEGIEGHDDVVASFRDCLQRGRLGSTFLFVGPEGIGKRMLAIKLAEALLCERHEEDQLTPCGQCPACQQVHARTHPDLLVIGKLPDRNFLLIEQFIGNDNQRMREGLCPWIAMKPARGRRKIAIVDDADYFNADSANCLLKTLEEPPPGSVLILIGTSVQRQLPTIRSRSQIVRFRPLSQDVVGKIITAQGWIENQKQLPRVVSLSGGSVSAALEWCDEELGEFRRKLGAALAKPAWNSVLLARFVTEFVESAGSDTPARRKRLRLVMRMVVDFYRSLLRGLSGAPSLAYHDDEDLVDVLCQAWTGDEEHA